MDEIKILHGSDIHNRDECIDKLDYIKQHYPYRIVVDTGDSCHDGDESQYKWLRSNYWFLRDHEIPVYAVPGNHNIKKTGLWPFDERTKLRRFDSTFGTKFAQSQMPSVNIIDDRVVLIGLNSNPLWYQGWLTFARGNIGIRQRWNLEVELAAHKDKVRVVYLHHHPFLRDIFMELSDSVKVMQILSMNCDVLLFGHKHLQNYHSDAAKEYGIPIIHAAGAMYRETEALEITIGDKITTKYVSIV